MMQMRYESNDHDSAEYDDEAGMAHNSLATIERACKGLSEVIQMGDNLPEWCQEKIAVAKNMLVAVWDYMESEEATHHETEAMDMPFAGAKAGHKEGPAGQLKGNMRRPAKAGDLVGGESISNEAEYHGKNVPLGKKLPGDVKKSKVYVRKPNGNIVKVNFGDKKMRIKKSNPARRRSFRARHNCKNPGPRWKARYWSCRSW